jgi:tRNA nucleotidyltransferase (CCA-adding enzyme)
MKTINSFHNTRMIIEVPPFVQKILQTVRTTGFEISIVGGVVRDILSKHKQYDWDFTTNAKPEEILKLFPDGFYDNVFGTVGIPYEGATYEITTYRTEIGYSDLRHPDKVSWGNSLEEDLSRRDFTINAMALKVLPNSVIAQNTDFELIDPYHGREDLTHKLIRAVRDPNERFKEDALRMLRAVRFGAQLGFTIEEKTLEAIQKNAPAIVSVSGERIREEMKKILNSDYAADGILLLHSSGILQYILPELEKGYQMTQAKHHKYDVFTHSINALRETPSKKWLVRLATLLHDVGKPVVMHGEGEERTFYNHEVVGANIARSIADRWHFSKEEREKFVTLIRWHQFSVDEFQTDKAIRRFIVRVGNDNLEDIFHLRIGDRLGSGCTKAESWRLKKYMQRTIDVQKHTPSVKDLKVNGKDIMETLHIEPGPKVGGILNKLFEEITEDTGKNEKEYLIQRIKEYGKD